MIIMRPKIKLIIIRLGLIVILIRLSKIVIVIIIIIDAVGVEQCHGGGRWSAVVDPNSAVPEEKRVR